MRKILESESPELFLIQNKLLEKISHDVDINNIIRLSLLNTLSPISDYKAAVSILLPYIGMDDNHTLDIIGAHLSSNWIFDKDNLFLKGLFDKLTILSPELQSMVWYIGAWDLFCKNKFPVDYLKKSVDLCDSHVKNLLLLANYSSGPLKKQLKEQARSNVKEILSIEDLKKIKTEDFIEPKQYINEFITGISMDELMYKESFLPN